MKRRNRQIRAGAWQFTGSGDVGRNLEAIRRGMRQAARWGVRLLVTQECALCGYPPVEVESARAIDRQAQAEAGREVARLAKEYGLYVVLGMASFAAGRCFNTARLVGPDGRWRAAYHKRALYGWDSEHFEAGRAVGGVYEVEAVRVGVRICYEVRFPEYFRELLSRRVDLVVMPFAAGGNETGKLEVMRCHLVSRAAENVMWVLSANSTSRRQTAPTCLIDPDGKVVEEAPLNREALLVGEVVLERPDVWRRGRAEHSRTLWGK